MKIGITTFGGDGGKSGISRYIINLLREFSRIQDEFEFEFEVLVYEDETEIFLKDLDHLSVLTFSKRMVNPVLNIAWHQLQLGRICRQRQYDLVFLPAGNRRLSMHLPCPAVGTVHDLSSLHVKGKYSKFRQLYIFRILPWLIRKLAMIITVSESSRDDIIDFVGISPDNILVTHLAVDKQKYVPRDRADSFRHLKSRYDIRQPYLLYISRIEHPGKNHLRLIEAFNLLKEQHGIPHQLVLAGSDWNRAETVHQVARHSPYADDICFTGFVAEDDLPYFYSAADLFVFPSLFEGFGLPVLEAMSCGIPVACSNVSSLPEVAGDAARLFDPLSAVSMAAEISAILLDSGTRVSLAQKGKDRSELFSWEKTARETLKAFRRVLNNQTVKPE
jgi:glycosyltransferase involved in cell wall biosynthesis